IGPRHHPHRSSLVTPTSPTHAARRQNRRPLGSRLQVQLPLRRRHQLPPRRHPRRLARRPHQPRPLPRLPRDCPTTGRPRPHHHLRGWFIGDGLCPSTAKFDSAIILRDCRLILRICVHSV